MEHIRRHHHSMKVTDHKNSARDQTEKRLEEMRAQAPETDSTRSYQVNLGNLTWLCKHVAAVDHFRKQSPKRRRR